MNLNQKIKILLFSIIVLLNLSAYAQEFHVVNNSEIKALVSKTEITRLVFDLPVTEIHAISEEIEYVINGKDIYLRMLIEKPVNFFVRTEDERTYKLILIADDIPSTQVFVHKQIARVTYKNKLEYFGQIMPELKTRIAKIIEVALSPTKHLGYNITHKNIGLPSNIKNLKMKLDTQITGNHLVAEKINLIYKTDEPIKLNLKDFADSKYLAVYLNTTDILPRQEAVLIRVLEN